jgi:hypothetical protein
MLSADSTAALPVLEDEPEAAAASAVPLLLLKTLVVAGAALLDAPLLEFD